MTGEEPDAVTAARKAAQESLLLTAAEAVRAYNLLEVRRFDSILRNILEEGLFSVQKQILSPKRRSGSNEAAFAVSRS